MTIFTADLSFLLISSLTCILLTVQHPSRRFLCLYAMLLSHCYSLTSILASKIATALLKDFLLRIFVFSLCKAFYRLLTAREYFRYSCFYLCVAQLLYRTNNCFLYVAVTYIFHTRLLFT